MNFRWRYNIQSNKSQQNDCLKMANSVIANYQNDNQQNEPRQNNSQLNVFCHNDTHQSTLIF